MGIGLKRFAVESDWRQETLRTNLWLIPALESVAAVLLFVLTLSIDHAAFHRQLSLPSWVISGSPDAAREILAALAGALITVVGVVFSVMIVTLTLASQQFGPVTVALALTALDLGVLIYFIHHTATAIQLPEVIASIARDLTSAIDDECGGGEPAELANGPSPELLQARLDRGGAVVAAPTSGYLRFVRHATLVAIAAEYDAVIRLHDRPGHFLTRGHPMATVFPPEVADTIRHRLERVHITGLFTVMEVAPAGRTQVLLDQAALLQRLSERTVLEPADQADITVRYQALLTLHANRQQATAGNDESRPGPFGQKGL